MRQPQEQSVTRSIIAVMTALAFIFSPVSVFAQQGADGPVQAEGQPEGEAGEATATATQPPGPTPKLFSMPTLGVRDEVSSIIPERIGEMLRSQLRGRSTIKLLPKYHRLEQRGGGQANAAVAEAERLYTSGIGLLTAGEDKKAAEAFQEAVDIMEEHLAELDNFNVLADAYKNMALAYFNAGFDFDGRKKMKVFAHLRSDADLDEEKFPKELRAVFDDEVKKVEKGGPGKLIVEANIAEARVFVDGVEKGVVPMTIEDVSYGYHYMVIRAPNGSAWSEQIRVRGRGKSQEFEAEFGAQAIAAASDDKESDPAFYAGLKQGIESGSFGEDLHPYLTELTTRTGADYIAWVAMYKDRTGYVAVPFVYRPVDQRMVRAESVEFNFELSNLRVGVSQLADRVVETVETMPEDKVVASVELGSPSADKESAVASGDDARQTGESVNEAEASAAGGATALAKDDPRKDEARSVNPLPMPSKDEDASDRWLWLSAGGAAVLLTGLVVGGIVVMSDSGSDGTGSFDAQLTW